MWFIFVIDKDKTIYDLAEFSLTSVPPPNRILMTYLALDPLLSTTIKHSD